MDDVIAILDDTGHFEERLFADEEAMAFKDFREEDSVGDAGFVFEADENEPFGGAWALAADHEAADADESAIGEMREIGGAADMGDFVTDKSHGMLADSKAKAVVISLEAFDGLHHFEGRSGIGGSAGKEVIGVALDFDLPLGIAAMIGEAI